MRPLYPGKGGLIILKRKRKEIEKLWTAVRFQQFWSRVLESSGCSSSFCSNWWNKFDDWHRNIESHTTRLLPFYFFKFVFIFTSKASASQTSRINVQVILIVFFFHRSHRVEVDADERWTTTNHCWLSRTTCVLSVTSSFCIFGAVLKIHHLMLSLLA